MDPDRGGQTSALPQRALRTLDRVNVLPVVQRHPALRWLAPLAVVGVVGVVATGVFRASATSSPTTMPDTSPKSLLAAVQQPSLTAFSGTVVSRLSLGLPELPSIGSDSQDASSLASLLTGSHTLKVWYGGAEQQRVALLGATDETDVFRSGREVWLWSSAERSAVHTVLPKHVAGHESRSSYAVPSAPHSSLTPGGLADDLLQRLDPTTKVTVSADHRVANRDAYELVLTPRTDQTTIGSVRVAVDGETKVPLGVQVYARGSRTASVDVAFTSIDFAKPADTVFTFNPPDDAKVHRHQVHRPSGSTSAAAGNRPEVTTAGTGWATVWSVSAGSRVRALERGALADASTPVKGAWGSGRLFTSDLVSALVRSDGRVFAGAVAPDALYAAAAH